MTSLDSHAQYETNGQDDAEPSSIHIDLSNVENVQHFGELKVHDRIVMYRQI